MVLSLGRDLAALEALPPALRGEVHREGHELLRVDVDRDILRAGRVLLVELDVLVRLVLILPLHFIY